MTVFELEQSMDAPDSAVLAGEAELTDSIETEVLLDE